MLVANIKIWKSQQQRRLGLSCYKPTFIAVPRFTEKTRMTRKTAEIPERPKNNGETMIGEYNKMYMLFIYNWTIQKLDITEKKSIKFISKFK